MPEHSVIVGGSTAARVVNCPASVQELLNLPAIDAKGTESDYAREGSLLHDYMAGMAKVCIGKPIDAALVEMQAAIYDKAFYEGVGAELVESCLAPAIDAIDKLVHEDFPDDDIQIVGVELHVRIPGIPGAFGTLDLALKGSTALYLLDYKFGAGVPVEAVYPDAALGDRINEQLLYYLTGFASSHRKLMRGVRKIVLGIIQPRAGSGEADEVLKMVEVTRREMRAFHGALEAAVENALSHHPHRERGDWCRFAPCKTTCPLWTGPLLDLSRMGVPPMLAPQTDEEYAEYLTRALDLITLLEPAVKSIKEHAHAFLERGGKVDGYKLVGKRATRSWRDAAHAAATLHTTFNIPLEALHTTEMKSPYAIEQAKLLPRGQKVPEDLVVAVSSGTTLAPAGDDRPSVEPAQRQNMFAAALAALREGH